MTKKEIEHVIKALRKATLSSPARNECLRRASKKVQEGNTKKGKPKFKTYWQCASCRSWYRDSRMLEVDHIVEIGPFKGDWHDYVMRMHFCGQKNLQALCNVCHQKKTSNFNARLKYRRK